LFLGYCNGFINTEIRAMIVERGRTAKTDVMRRWGMMHSFIFCLSSDFKKKYLSYNMINKSDTYVYYLFCQFLNWWPQKLQNRWWQEGFKNWNTEFPENSTWEGKISSCGFHFRHFGISTMFYLSIIASSIHMLIQYIAMNWKSKTPHILHLLPI
jgi:hypothetical protein